MAKKNNEKKMNPFIWFLVAIAIPVIVVITLIMIILNVAGYDATSWVKDKGNNIPVVSNMITTEEEADLKSKEADSQEIIENKNQEIEHLNQHVADLEIQIDDLNQEILLLESNSDEQRRVAETSEVEDINEAVKTVAKSYEEMDSEQAAIILENMENRTSVVTILQEISNDSRGEILQEMNPEIAADITQRLMGNSN